MVFYLQIPVDMNVIKNIIGSIQRTKIKNNKTDAECVLVQMCRCRAAEARNRRAWTSSTHRSSTQVGLEPNQAFFFFYVGDGKITDFLFLRNTVAANGHTPPHDESPESLSSARHSSADMCGSLHLTASPGSYGSHRPAWWGAGGGDSLHYGHYHGFGDTAEELGEDGSSSWAEDR